MIDQSPIEPYVAALRSQLASGQALEHAYRPALKALMDSFADVNAINDPKRSAHGNPDFVFLKASNPNVIRGYAEAKDITVELDRVEKTDQLKRYAGYDNLFLTNYLDFRFYRNGERYQQIVIGELHGSTIQFLSERFADLVAELARFLELPPETITSGSRLAKIMGAKAQRIRSNVARYLGEATEKNDELEKIYRIMRELLVHDLSVDSFADMYAQTLVYGLFVARYYDDSADTFSRQEARDLVPASNPFLRHFFDHIAGPDFDTRLSYIVDELCEVFAHADVKELMQQYFKQDLWGKEQAIAPDPVIHFYEDFLKEYDEQLRKRMGAYYTPLPVVNFIIRSVDQILQKDFGLVQGLADTSKLGNGSHRVQILDPAVGTGTFISATIRLIYERLLKQSQRGRWPTYVHNDLLPRLHGFELMMAPYTIAHLKLSLAFKQTGFWKFHRRLGIYLTNSLEQAGQQPDMLSLGFAQTIAEEAKEAAVVKNQTPVMIVIGNPPYSGVSSNETKYANELVAKYKVEPGGHLKLQERKHWLNDDYVKFIAFAEAMIAKNGTGVVGMITNHGYLDNPTFRGMRWHLAQTFDTIYVLDLHGNAKKKETAPDGGKDENVFDIQQGVAIMIAVKTGEKRGTPAKVFYADLFGTRRHKFDALQEPPNWKPVTLDQKMVYFVPKDTTGHAKYDQGISLADLFSIYNTGIVTMGDNFIVADNPQILKDRIEKFIRGEFTEDQLNREFGLGKNYAKWVLENRHSIQFDPSKVVRLAYRPFDDRYTYFDNKLVWRHREKVMKNFLERANVGILFSRMTKGKPFAHAFITNDVSEVIYLSPLTGTNAFNAPLWLYQEDGTRTANFRPEELSKLIVNLTESPTPERVLDYIYAALYSPSYRKKYAEFLKTDFPRVPIPTSDAEFARLAKLGARLRELHLLTASDLASYDTTFPIAGSNLVEEVRYWPIFDFRMTWEGQDEGGHKAQSVEINKTQYFGNVPEVAWNFYIGGYQPAQKWLKDRKGCELSNEDLDHYQKMIKALAETQKVMNGIDG